MLFSRRRSWRYIASLLAGVAVYIFCVMLRHRSSDVPPLSDADDLPHNLGDEYLAKKQQDVIRLVDHDRGSVHLDISKYASESSVVNFGVVKRRAVLHCKGVVKLLTPVSAPREIWQSVHPGGSDIYVYSAFFLSPQSAGRLRILTMYLVHKKQSSALFCQLWYRRDAQVMRAVSASIAGFPEGKGKIYNSGYISCENPSSDEIPFAVSVSFSMCGETGNMLPVELVSALSTAAPIKIGLCVTPLNLNYDKVDQMLEYLEVNRVFGASHVTLYNYSSNARVAHILQSYIQDGYVSVKQWHLPMKVHVWPVPPNYQEEMYYFGQLAALNDCLMRARGRFHLVGFFDLDELAVPRQHASWQAMIQDSRVSGATQLPRSITFLNTFFKLEWPSDSVLKANKSVARLHAASLLKVRRETHIQPEGSRSKLLLDPNLVDVMGVHNVWQWSSAADDVAVRARLKVVLPPELGLLHHYRFWDGLGEQTWIEDRGLVKLHREAIVHTLTAARRRFGLLNSPAEPGRGTPDLV